MEEPKIATLGDAQLAYNKASARVAHLCRTDPGSRIYSTGKEAFAVEVWAAVADFMRTGGDLAVTALEQLAEIEKNRRLAAESHERSLRRLSWVVAVATAVYAAATIAFYWYQWQHPSLPPVVNITAQK